MTPTINLRSIARPRPWPAAWIRTAAVAASLAYADLLDLRVELFPYAPFAARTWELRANLTCYAAWYVALAESLGSKVATLDLRLARASGPRVPLRDAARAGLICRHVQRAPASGSCQDVPVDVLRPAAVIAADRE